MSIRDLGLGRYESVLRAAGIDSLEQLLARNRRELLALPRVGIQAIVRVEAALADRGLALAVDEWTPYRCARDGKESWDTSLCGLFLCASCTKEFIGKVFDGAKPVYASASVDGYCDHCNLLRKVALRQWLLCNICYRVLKSIGRGVVAARHFRSYWETAIGPKLSGVELIETDPPELRRRDDSPDVTPRFDFLAVNRGTPAFGFELKTGRSHLGKGGVGSGMGRFQLDTSDCDDMSRSIREAGAPGYLVHIQVVDRAAPPTIRYAAVGLWWTDMYRMSEAFRETTQRPRENRPAAYYDVKMFGNVASLVDHLVNGGAAALKRRLKSEGLPALYRV